MRLNLVLRNTEEVISQEELKKLLEEKPRPKAYWGFECSGLMHIGMGLITGSKIKDLVDAGFDYVIFLADWHSWINNKLGGDMEKIRLVGEYFKHCFTALGIPPDKVRYIWSSELTSDSRYWEIVIKVAKNSTLNRIRRSLPIMGRGLTEGGDIEAAWLIYPCMQVADIFYMDLDVACGGIDQRKAHMLARDVADKLGFKKPICVHTPLLMGLEGPGEVKGEFDEDQKTDLNIASKMSKSLPERCIFIHDEPEEIKLKLRKAYCPPRESTGNPVMELARLVVYPKLGKLMVKRPSGEVEFVSYGELEAAYLKGEVHPLDLKEAIAEALIEILKPVREYFKGRSKLLEKVKAIEATR
ncbi:MAG: tyrosine--tRNA ligase [Thermoprotei archaeon]|nr:MAG: tyrosine--tRNA ligase [Thermoprotei archaeon]RLF18416.1 MAG: tyrosine--tRNA ligase [Thermoprotei archaeon]